MAYSPIPILMRLLLSAAMLGGVAGARADALADAAGEYRIESSSSIRFTVGQVGGGGIHGRFGVFSGSFRIEEPIARSAVAFTLMPDSVATGESRVDDFLRSDAVFDAAAHPRITFRSTKVTRIGENAARVEGMLTAHGISHRERFDVSVLSRKGRDIAFHVTGSIYRSPYRMDVGVPVYSNVVAFDMRVDGRRK